MVVISPVKYTFLASHPKVEERQIKTWHSLTAAYTRR